MGKSYLKPLFAVFCSLLFLFIVDLLLHPFTSDPWLSDAHQKDRYLLWKGIPHATSKIRVSLFGETPVQYKLNSQGFRTDETGEKDENTLRIINMGYSTTFGLEVLKKDTYSDILQVLMDEKYPDQKFEVINLGVLGYSSLQGLILLKRFVLDLDPDFITICYGYQDNHAPHTQGMGYCTDKELIEFNNSLLGRIRELMLHSNIYNIMENWAIKMRNKRMNSAPEKEWKNIKRVPPEQFRENMKEMIEIMVSSGITPILINHYWLTENDLDSGENSTTIMPGGVSPTGDCYYNSPYNKIIDRIGSEDGIIVVNTKETFDKAYFQLQANPEYKEICKKKFPDFFKLRRSYFQYFYTGDVHTTKYGNYLIAEAISENINLPD